MIQVTTVLGGKEGISKYTKKTGMSQENWIYDHLIISRYHQRKLLFN